MPHTNRIRVPRWRFAVPPEKTAPRGGIECAKSALTRLGPFKHKCQDDADRLGPATAFHGRMAVSEELAVQKIWWLAAIYLEHEEISKGAPRIKDVLESLTAVGHLAGLFATVLESLDDFTRSYLQNAGTGLADYCRFACVPHMEQADAEGLPLPAEENNYPRADSWVHRLRELQQYASLTSQNFLTAKGIADPKRPDKGGNSNLYKHLYGTPDWNLVNEGWHIYEMFRPGTATGTEGGEFHLFLMNVFEFATGRDPEEHGGLLPWLKSIPPKRRKMQDLTAQEIKLIEEENELDPKELGLAEWQRRLQEIEQKHILIYQEKYKLWPDLYPYTYGRAAGREPRPKQMGHSA